MNCRWNLILVYACTFINNSIINCLMSMRQMARDTLFNTASRCCSEWAEIAPSFAWTPIARQEQTTICHCNNIHSIEICSVQIDEGHWFKVNGLHSIAIFTFSTPFFETTIRQKLSFQSKCIFLRISNLSVIEYSLIFNRNCIWWFRKTGTTNCMLLTNISCAPQHILIDQLFTHSGVRFLTRAFREISTLLKFSHMHFFESQLAQLHTITPRHTNFEILNFFAH